MHFSIPETLEHRDLKGASFTVFVVHINGIRHCTVRYRQLHSLFEQLKREYPARSLPSFPPKKLLPLNKSQIEDRRSHLEKFLQLLSQDDRVVNGVTFNGFLLGAQLETRAELSNKFNATGHMAEEKVNLEVFLMNDDKITTSGSPALQTNEVLEETCRKYGVPEDLVYNFALFLSKKSENGDLIIVRKLQDYESPFISQKSFAAHGDGLKLVLRKASWDISIDQEMMKNSATLNLLYLQTINDIERGWIQANPETKKMLTRMQARGAKKEYMEMACQLPNYGYIHFQPCVCDYPMSNTPAQVQMGKYELVMKIRTARGEIKEGAFQVTKMRCWRIMTLTSNEPDDFRIDKDDGSDQSSGLKTKLELSIEYLMNNQELQWITIVSSQAILMSICLQSMVEELLRLKNKVPLRKAGEKSCSIDYPFQTKDGTLMNVPIKSGIHSHCNHITGSAPKIDEKTLSAMTGRHYSVKKLSDKFEVVNYRETSRVAEDIFIENEAFMDIRESDGKQM